MPTTPPRDISPDKAMTDVANALNLTKHADGYFENIDDPPQRLVLLGAGGLLAWQRNTARQVWLWLAGAPLALTVSPDGHDAQAFHLDASRTDAVIAEQVWHTGETLGRWSLMRIEYAPAPDLRHPATPEYAALDWYPTPRGTRQADN